GGKAKRNVTIGYVRDGRANELMLVPDGQGKYEMGDIGIQPIVHPEVVDVSPGQPAAQAGLRKGDAVIGINGERNISYDKMIATIKGNEDKPIQFLIRRDNGEQTVTVTPRKTGGTVIMGAHLLPYETRTIEPGPLEAVKLSLDKNWEWTRMIVETLAGLITRETSVKQLMGPVAIADLSGSAAQAGWIPLFSLMPIPVLDGGHIFILALEGLARRDFSMRVKEKMLLAGFVLLLMLMVTVIYNDLMRIQWIEKLVPGASRHSQRRRSFSASARAGARSPRDRHLFHPR